MSAGLGSTNAHRMTKHKGYPARCSEPDCTWEAKNPRDGHGSERAQYRRHLYEIAPKRRDVR